MHTIKLSDDLSEDSQINGIIDNQTFERSLIASDFGIIEIANKNFCKTVPLIYENDPQWICCASHI